MAHHQHHHDTGSEDELEAAPRPSPHTPTTVHERAQTALRWTKVVMDGLKLAHDIAQSWPWSLL